MMRASIRRSRHQLRIRLRAAPLGVILTMATIVGVSVTTAAAAAKPPPPASKAPNPPPPPPPNHNAPPAQPAYCQAQSAQNFSPDPFISGGNKYFENNIATIPSSTGVIGIPTNQATTGSVSSPASGDTFAAGWLEETELYQYLNNSTGGPGPNGSPGAYDATQPGLTPPVGTVIPLAGGSFTGPSLPTTGAGLPYAAVFNVNADGSLGSQVSGDLPVTITQQNYTPNTEAWQHDKIAQDPTYGQPLNQTCGGNGLYTAMSFTAAGVAGLTPGKVYAAYLLVRDTDQSGPLSNHVWYFTPTVPANKISFAYADTYRLNDGSSHGIPSPWAGGANVIFEGCNYFSSDICPSGTAPDGNDYDAGVIGIENNSGSSETISGVNASSGPVVTIGQCTYSPWPNLNVSVPSGDILILTQTGGPDPCGPQLGISGGILFGNFNFDGSESAAQSVQRQSGVCANDGLIPQVSLEVNGQSQTINDTNQILNTGGVDPGSAPCSGINEYQPWDPPLP